MNVRRLLVLCIAAIFEVRAADTKIVGRSYELNDNGVWSWFMDERAIVDAGRLLIGSVRANGRFEHKDRPGWGNVELAIFDFATAKHDVIILHEHLEQDDHDNPGFIRLPNGHYLAMYSKHNVEPKFYYRISEKPENPYSWGPIREFVTPILGTNSAGHRATYANPFYLSQERRLYLFHRGLGLDPNYLVSQDNGNSWRYGGRVFIGRDGYSPYVKYASNNRDTIHFVATEDHPRNYDNSLFHGFIREGKVHASDGKVVTTLATNSETQLRPWNLTTVFQGSPTNVAWMCDVELDGEGNPVILFTTQRDGAGLPRGSGGIDHRFHYARWDGSQWNTREIAYAGTRLYPGEDDYTGLGAIHPKDPNVIFISTDAHPVTGAPLNSRSSYRRHHELFAARTADGGITWKWKAITSDSSTDNLRPIVPKWNDERTALCWMRGSYRNNHGEWGASVMLTIVPASDLNW